MNYITKDLTDPETGKKLRLFIDPDTNRVVHSSELGDYDKDSPITDDVQGSEHLKNEWDYGLPGMDRGPFYEENMKSLTEQEKSS